MAHWHEKKVMSLEEYLESLVEDARPARTSFQRAFDMIDSDNSEFVKVGKNKRVLRYDFFLDRQIDGTIGKDAIFGLEMPLYQLVKHIKSGALGYGIEKRIFLLHGPVGSAKSTIARILKKGIQRYSLQEPLFTFRWKGLGNFDNTSSWMKVRDHEGKEIGLFDFRCAMNEDPIRLLDDPQKVFYIDKDRALKVKQLLKNINEKNLTSTMEKVMQGDEDYGKTHMRYKVNPDWGLCVQCRHNYSLLMEHYDNNWEEIMKNHIEVIRMIISEEDRVGVGTFQPKDEKNQDSTELTGNIDFRRIAYIGNEADPRAFNLYGELCKANRGILEVIEMLKLDVAFLYDFLTASEEKRIKPKNFAHTPIDEIIIGHTNHEEYEKLQENKYMRALRDRTDRIDVPYNLVLDNEGLIYHRDYFNEDTFAKRVMSEHGEKILPREKTVFKHISPLTFDIAAKWAILTRLVDPKDSNISRLQKLHLYNGTRLPKIGEEKVEELKNEGSELNEGMDGVSPRIIQMSIADALADEESKKCLNAFMVLRAVKDNVRTHASITREEDRKKYISLLETAEDDLYRVATEHVQIAVGSDEESMGKLADDYIREVKAYVMKEKIYDPRTQRQREASDPLMREIEEKMGITDTQKDEFRSSFMTSLAAYFVEGQKFDWRKEDTLKKAIGRTLFDRNKERFKIENIITTAGEMSDEERDKFQAIVGNMKKTFSYCDVCATDTLNYVSAELSKNHLPVELYK